MLLGKGPRIPMKLTMLTSSRVSFRNALSDAGINQTKHQLLLEVEVEDDRVFRYDQTFYNEALAAMERRRDLAGALALAERYFSRERSGAPIIEILSDGANRVLRELSIEGGEG